MNTPFINYIADQRILSEEDKMLLVDVGASGGVHPKWFAFKGAVSAIGFDPLVMECERLNTVEHPIEVRYIPAFVGAPPHLKFPSHESKGDISQRLSVSRANEKLKVSSNSRYNYFQEVILSEKRITLDEYFREELRKPDFIKIDTDGHDIEVLLGCTRLLSSKEVLGICVESQFHGPVHENANTFANIDIFMRENGFSLFDLEFHRYSRAALPGKFLLSIPAQTDIGQVQWADALYFRDLADMQYEKTWGKEYTESDILKLACLFELHMLHDCAVELLMNHRERLAHVMDVDFAIDLLAPPINGHPATLGDYEERFNMSLEEMKFLQDGNLQNLTDRRRKKLKKYKKVLYFGAGGRLRASFDRIGAYFNSDITIKVTDNDREKWGQSFFQKEVIPPEKIPDYDPDIVVIVSTYAQEILPQLIRLKNKNDLDFRISCA